MNANPIRLWLTAGLNRLVRFGSGLAAPPATPARPTRQRAGRALLAFTSVLLLANGGLALWLDFGPLQLCDPESGRRIARLQKRTLEQPDRPLVLVLGSSRSALGIRPDLLPAEPGRPMLFNLSQAGAGPILELLVFRRALATGITPDAVLIEYWPAFLREDGPYHEAARFPATRLRPQDRPTIREFFPDPDAVDSTLWRRRFNPYYEHRQMLWNQIYPRFLPDRLRAESMWARIDDWGWLPGRNETEPDQAKQMLAGCGNYYQPLFSNYEVSPVADRALRALVAECRNRRIPVALLYLPEASGFRTFLPPAASEIAAEYLTRIVAELNLPLIDCRNWMPDRDLPDGFHLTIPAAAEFTRKLAPAVEATFALTPRKP